MSAASRTVVCDDSTSQEAQEYMHQFPITYNTLTSRAKGHLKHEGKQLLHVIQSLDKKYPDQDINGIHCAEIALFACNVFRAAAEDIYAEERHITFARNEAQLLKRLIKPKNKECTAQEAKRLQEYINKKLKKLGKNEAWMKETVALWRALKAQGVFLL